jgi:hypothetical protein
MAKKNIPTRGPSKHGGFGGKRASKGGGISITKSGNKSGTSGSGKKK